MTRADAKASADAALAAGTITRAEHKRITKSLLTSPRGGRKVSVPTNHHKESITMTRKTTTSKSTPKSAPSKAKSSKVSTDVTAAQAARDAGISGPRFRAWLRANDMPRQWTNKTLANKAVAAFKKATAK